MKNILVTGANGFIGKNLIEHLNRLENINIFKYDINNTEDELEEFVLKADFIFHLAGVNRPKDESEFKKGNIDLTKKIIDFIVKANKNTPILLSSSTQAKLDNPYGISKNCAEKEIFDYIKSTNSKSYVYRLPNVFGKWSKPNYNSVVTTFCYNIANDLPIQINDPNTNLTLVYIDDVCEEFLNAFNGKSNTQDDGFSYVNNTYIISLKNLADKLYIFKEIRKNLVMPGFSDEFTKKLYSTWLSYLDISNLSYELEMKRDNRGWLSEFIKSKEFGQVFVSSTKQGVTRGNHWHHTKVEKFLVISGDAVIKFRNINTDEKLEYRVSGCNLEVVDIPVGYTHSVTNIGDNELITLFWANEIFDFNKSDTYYLEV